MASCKACGAPLDGPLSFISGLLGVKKSRIAPGYCSKCEDMALARKRAGTLKSRVKKKVRKSKTPKRRTKKKSSRRVKKRTTKRKKTRRTKKRRRR